MGNNQTTEPTISSETLMEIFKENAYDGLSVISIKF